MEVGSCGGESSLSTSNKNHRLREGPGATNGLSSST